MYPCAGVHRKTSFISYFLLLHQYPACLAHLTLMVGQKEGTAGILLGSSYRIYFKIYAASLCSSHQALLRRFLKFQVVPPYDCTNMITASSDYLEPKIQNCSSFFSKVYLMSFHFFESFTLIQVFLSIQNRVKQISIINVYAKVFECSQTSKINLFFFIIIQCQPASLDNEEQISALAAFLWFYLSNHSVTCRMLYMVSLLSEVQLVGILSFSLLELLAILKTKKSQCCWGRKKKIN